MAILSEKTWDRHANPWSGWTRVLAMPLLGAGLLAHSYALLGLFVVWVVVNPWLFPKPKRTDNWMSQGVLGERLYFAEGKKMRKDLPTLLNCLNVLAFAAFAYYGWQGNFAATVLAGLLVMTIKFWFIDRMVQVYRSSGR